MEPSFLTSSIIGLALAVIVCLIWTLQISPFYNNPYYRRLLIIGWLTCIVMFFLNPPTLLNGFTLLLAVTGAVWLMEKNIQYRYGH